MKHRFSCQFSTLGNNIKYLLDSAHKSFTKVDILSGQCVLIICVLILQICASVVHLHHLNLCMEP